MKLLTKLFLVAAVAAFGTSMATADDRQVDCRTPERARTERDTRPTVGAYAERRDISQREQTAINQPPCASSYAEPHTGRSSALGFP